MLSLGLFSNPFAALRGAEPAPWTPLSVGSLTQWGDIDDLQDSAHGAAISEWTAKAGNIVMSSTGTLRPLWNAPERCIQFDGVNDLLGNDQSAGQSRETFFSAAAGELWMVVNPQAAVGNHGFGFFGNGYSGGMNWFADNSTIYFDCDTYFTGRVTVARPSGWAHQWHIVRVVVDGTARRIEVDGVEILNTTTTYSGIPSSVGGTCLGLTAGSAYGAIGLRDWATFNAPLSPEDAEALRDYWAAKFSGIFTPRSLSSLTEWFSITSLAGTDDGAPVGSWKGEKGLVTLDHTGSERPAYALDDGDGLISLQFDGINDRLMKTINNAALFGDTGYAFEVWIVVKIAEDGPGGLFSSTGISNQIGAMAADPGNVIWSAAYGSVNVVAPANLRDGEWHVLRFNKSGATRIISNDSEEIYHEETSNGPYVNGDDVLALGDYFGSFLHGSVRHFLTFNNALSTEDASALQAYLSAWTPNT